MSYPCMRFVINLSQFCNNLSAQNDCIYLRAPCHRLNLLQNCNEVLHLANEYRVNSEIISIFQIYANYTLTIMDKIVNFVRDLIPNPNEETKTQMELGINHFMEQKESIRRSFNYCRHELARISNLSSRCKWQEYPILERRLKRFIENCLALQKDLDDYKEEFLNIYFTIWPTKMQYPIWIA